MRRSKKGGGDDRKTLKVLTLNLHSKVAKYIPWNTPEISRKCPVNHISRPPEKSYSESTPKINVLYLVFVILIL